MATELIERRTRHAKHFLRTDGRYEAQVQGGVGWHYKAADGSWGDRNTNFRAVSTTEWIVDQNDVRVRIYSTTAKNTTTWWLELTGLISGTGIRFQLPKQPTISGDTASYTDAVGNTWTYTVRPEGAKLMGPPVSASTGAQTFTYPFEYVGASAPLAVQADGSLTNGEIVIPRAGAIGANRVFYPAGAWTLPTATTLSFAWGDAGIPASAYPYRVDPTTEFPIAVGEDDGFVRRFGATYPPTGAETWNFISGVDQSGKNWVSNLSEYRVFQSLYRWDTSSIPDGDTIDSATFRGYCLTTGTGDADGRSIGGRWEAWTGSSATDYDVELVPDAFTKLLSSFTLSAQFDIPLSALGGISKTGFTYLKTGISGGQPTGINQLNVEAFEGTTAGAVKPTLIITYSTNITYEETMRPNDALWLSNLTGTFTDIADDPDAPDASWLVSP